MKRAARLIALPLIVGSWVAPARSHTLSESHSSWQITGDSVRLEMIVPELEARRLSTSGKDLPTSAALGAYLAARMGASAGTRNCPLAEGPRKLSATPGFFREELVFKCPSGRNLQISFGRLLRSRSLAHQFCAHRGWLGALLRTAVHARSSADRDFGRRCEHAAKCRIPAIRPYGRHAYFHGTRSHVLHVGTRADLAACARSAVRRHRDSRSVIA